MSAENTTEENLRKPNLPEKNISSNIQNLISKISAITSPDDLEVKNVASEIKNYVVSEQDLKELVEELCDIALRQREISPVVGAVCGQVNLHQVGDMRFRSLLFQRVQNDYSSREALASTDRSRFVSSAMLLGEIFYYVKSDRGAPFKVLAEPVITYLSMVLKPHLASDPATDVNEEAIVVAKQLLQNGPALCQFAPKGLEEIVRDVTEIMIRHSLNDACKLNLLSALGELWPKISESLNPRTLHASLAARLGLSLQI